VDANAEDVSSTSTGLAALAAYPGKNGLNRFATLKALNSRRNPFRVVKTFHALNPGYVAARRTLGWLT
jgi:hypothetical protein